MPLLVVDPWDWLDEDGHFLFDNPRIYRRMLRVARFIEYGGLLKKNETRETLIECKRRPKGKSCHGLMWVVKTEDDGILAHCLVCKTEEDDEFKKEADGIRNREGLAGQKNYLGQRTLITIAGIPTTTEEDAFRSALAMNWEESPALATPTPPASAAASPGPSASAASSPYVCATSGTQGERGSVEDSGVPHRR